MWTLCARWTSRPLWTRHGLAASADCQALAMLASATIHTIAIRARAKVPRAELDAIVKGALDVICR